MITKTQMNDSKADAGRITLGILGGCVPPSFPILTPKLFQAKTCHFSHPEWLDLRFEIHTLFQTWLGKIVSSL